MPLRYWLLIISLGAVWGCSFFFNAILIREISPLWVAAGRVTIGAAICWVYFVAMRKRLPGGWPIYAQLLVLGLLNYAIPFSLFPFAEQTVASGIVGVINGLTPMSTVIVSQLWPGGERATWNKWVGVSVGFVGAVESKQALAADGRVPFAVVHGRRGGSAMAAAAVNALAHPTECADVKYVTVVNQGCASGDEAAERLRPADPKATAPICQEPNFFVMVRSRFM